MKELKRIDDENEENVPKLLFRYMLGKLDFYKVITEDRNRTTRIEVININGSLNASSGKEKPIAKVPVLKMPTQFYHIDFKPNSDNTIEVACDEGWQISVRIRNASSRVEPSLNHGQLSAFIVLNYIVKERLIMKIHMLGTGNALVTEVFNTCFVLENENGNFLVDGGGGNYILKRLKAANINYLNIHEIFVTHKHVDHILGIIWMIRVIATAINKGKYEGKLVIYAHDEVIHILKEISNMLLQKKEVKHFDDRIVFFVVEDGQKVNILGNEVTFFDIHSIKAKQFGFVMNYDEGKKLTCCGDEPLNEHDYKYARNSDWMLHEAFCLSSQADVYKPYEKQHSTVKDACILANQLNVKNLILYHTEDKNIKNRKELYMNEGKEFFFSNLYVPEDLDVIEIL